MVLFMFGAEHIESWAQVNTSIDKVRSCVPARDDMENHLQDRNPLVLTEHFKTCLKRILVEDSLAELQ